MDDIHDEDEDVDDDILMEEVVLKMEGVEWDDAIVIDDEIDSKERVMNAEARAADVASYSKKVSEFHAENQITQ